MLKTLATPYKNIFIKSLTFQFRLIHRQLDNKREGLQAQELAPVRTKAEPSSKN